MVVIGRHYRWFIAGFASAALLFGGASIAAETLQRDIRVTFSPLKYVFDGVERVPPADQQGFLYNNRTFVSLRFISEALGKPVEWDPNTYTIYVGRRPSPLPEPWSSYTVDGEGARKVEYYQKGARNLVGVEVPNALLFSSLVSEPKEQREAITSIQVEVPLPKGAKTVSGKLFVPDLYFGHAEEVKIGHITLINELNQPVYRSEPLTNRSGEIRFSAGVETAKQLRIVISLYHNQGIPLQGSDLYVAQLGLSDFQIK